MKQSEIAQRYEATEVALTEAKDKAEEFLYATMTKALPRHGFINTMSLEQLASSKKFLNELNSCPYQKELDELGIELDELQNSSNSNDKYLGIKKETWFNDMITRVKEIRNERRIQKLTNDLNILGRHLSEETLQAKDLAQLSNEKV